MSDLTAKLARHIVGYRSAELDSAALTVAKQCILDWYGVTFAGASEPVARILREELAGSSQGPASIVGFGTPLHTLPCHAFIDHEHHHTLSSQRITNLTYPQPYYQQCSQ